MLKGKPLFLTVLGIVSILGFLITAMESFGWTKLNPIFAGLIFVAIGGGLAIEGGWKKFFKYSKGGTTPVEFTHMVSVVFGVISITVGFLTMFNIVSQFFWVIKGWLSIIMIALIIIQTWLVK